MYLIGSFIGIGIIHLLAKLFGGQATFKELYNCLTISSVLRWLMVVPIVSIILGPIIGVWNIVISVIVVRKVHQLTTGKAIAVVLIPIVIIIILVVLIAVLLAATLLASIGGLAGLGGLAATYGG